MSDLKKKIDRLERAVAIETAYIEEQNTQLHKTIGNSKVVSFVLLGGVAFGYLFARKKSFKQILFKVGSATLFLRRVYKNIKPILPFF